MNRKSLFPCSPLLLFTFLMAFLGDYITALMSWVLLTGFAVSSMWLIWYMRTRKLVHAILPVAILGMFVALGLGALGNRMLFSP